VADSVSTIESDRWSSWKPQGNGPVVGVWRSIVLALLLIGSAIAIWLRFSASSLLWLDEAQSVNIAKAPLREIPTLLKQDGAPPLYYFLLHFWMSLFGTSDAAVRSLSGVISIVTVVLAFFVIRRVWGSEIGLISAVFIASSPFAIYYATETRMYSLVMLLVVLGIGALSKLFERQSLANWSAVTLVAALLAYTQYWSFYLLIVLAIWMAFVSLRAQSAADRKSGRLTLLGFAGAGILFLPWLPTFLYQRKHTGTPWGDPPNFLTAAVAVFHFHSNQALQVPLSDVRQRGMELIFILLFFLALVGTSNTAYRFRLNWRTEPRGRFLAWVVFGTLVLGVVVSHFTNNAYTPRYGAVVYVPLLVFLGVGIAYFRQAFVRVGLVVVIAVGFFIGAYQEIHTQRTQAQQVVSALTAHAVPGDVAIFCPDELGPTVLRVLPSGTVHSVGYPRFVPPDIVDWVDYNSVLFHTNPSGFVAKAEALAGLNRVWLVWSPGYGASGPACTQVAQVLAKQPNWQGTAVVDPDPQHYFQSMQLIEYTRK
jgi:uncharacterized membrane protein